jgi:hypothetical protein
MLDEVNIVVTITPPEEVILRSTVPFNFNGLEFIPKYCNSEVLKYYCDFGNLKLTIYHNELRISNSWHKFYKGNNYSDYSRTELIETFNKIQTQLDINLDDAIIKSIAYGCVINENPYNNFKNWLYYKGKNALPMYSKGKQYGNLFDLYDFRLKGYDKTLEVKVHDKEIIQENQFRVECEVNYMRHLRKRKEPINIFKPRDLFNINNQMKLMEDLLNKYRTITKRPMMNLKGLNPHELNVLASMQNEPIREQFKMNHPDTLKRYKRIFKTINAGENSEPYNKVEEKIRTKILTLINT